MIPITELAVRPLPSIIFLVTSGAILLTTACSTDEAATSANADRPFEAVASTPVIAEWLRELGDDRITITALTQPGADEHTLQLTPGQIAAIASADLVVLNGGGLEAAYNDTVQQNLRGELLVLTDGIALEPFTAGFSHQEHAEEDAEGEDEHDAVDPHFWLDPERAIVALESIRNTLAVLDPDGADFYTTNATRYIESIRTTDAELRATIAVLPPERRLLVSFHDAYGYFARHYGLEIIGFVVERPDSEPSAGDVAALVTIMRERSARFIFQEPQYDARIVEQVARESGAAVRTLYAQPTGDAPTYLEMLRANAYALSK